MTDDCMICERLALWRAGNNPYFIAEFEHSILVVGDHQYHRGYCVLLYKDHIRDLHNLPPEAQIGVFRDLMTATNAVVKTFQPDKMNHASFGNVVPHIHWHIIPRYLADPHFLDEPFAHGAEFAQYTTSPETARRLAAEVRAHL